MTGPGHYEQAEILLSDAAALYETDPGKARFKHAAAHTHAILAQAAALALASHDDVDSLDHQQWHLVASLDELGTS